MKFIKNLFLILFGFLIGLGVCYYFYYQLHLKNKTIEQQLLAKNIKQVTKMITIEANYETVLTHKDFLKYDFYPFRKEVNLKVKAKVIAGTDIEKLIIEIDETNKTISISNFPKSEILSVDTDIEFKNLKEGFFNSFDEKELSNLNLKAKEQIIQIAKEDDLILKADERGIELLKIIKILSHSAGYKVFINNNLKL